MAADLFDTWLLQRSAHQLAAAEGISLDAALARLTAPPNLAGLPDLVWFPPCGSPEFTQMEERVRRGVITCGINQDGDRVDINLAGTPHIHVSAMNDSGGTPLLNIVLFWGLYLPDAFEVVVCDPTGELDWVTEFGPARYATTAADIATAMREVTDSLDRRHTLLASHASERIETLPRLSAEGEPIDVPRRLLVVLNQIGTITDGDPMVLHAEGRGALDQVLMLGRAAGIHVIASVRRPSAFTTAGHSLLYSVKVGLGWMSEPFSYLAIGTPGCADLDPVTPEDRGWFVVDGEDDVVVQMYKLPVRSHNEVGDEPERVGVVERIRQRPAHIPGRST